MEGKTNESIIGKYEDDVLMMMYDSVVIVNKDELVKQNNIKICVFHFVLLV